MGREAERARGTVEVKGDMMSSAAMRSHDDLSTQQAPQRVGRRMFEAKSTRRQGGHCDTRLCSVGRHGVLSLAKSAQGASRAKRCLDRVVS